MTATPETVNETPETVNLRVRIQKDDDGNLYGSILLPVAFEALNGTTGETREIGFCVEFNHSANTMILVVLDDSSNLQGDEAPMLPLPVAFWPQLRNAIDLAVAAINECQPLMQQVVERGATDDQIAALCQ